MGLFIGTQDSLSFTLSKVCRFIFVVAIGRRKSVRAGSVAIKERERENFSFVVAQSLGFSLEAKRGVAMIPRICVPMPDVDEVLRGSPDLLLPFLLHSFQ